MDTLKDISGFTLTTAGHMILSQEKSYSSSQNHNPQQNAPYPSQSTPNNSFDAVQFNEDDFSDDDNIDLDTDYDLPMSQSSFTQSQPNFQPGAYSQYHMPPPTQTNSWTPPSSSSYQGHRSMPQGSYALTTPTPRQPLATLSNNPMSTASYSDP